MICVKIFVVLNKYDNHIYYIFEAILVISAGNTTLWANSVDDIIKYFSYFSQKTYFDIS